MSKNQTRATYLALAAVLCWSTVATAFKLALMQLSPLQLLFFSALFSWLFLLGFTVVSGRLSLIKSTMAAEWKTYLQLGVLNPFLYYFVLFQAYDLLPAQQAQALNYTWAIMLSLLAVPLLGQRLRRQDLVALVLSYFGVLVICTKGDLAQLNFESVPGVLLALFSTLLWALYWIVNTKSKADPVVGLLCCFSISLPLIALLMSYQGVWMIPSLKAWLLSGYIGLFEMGITFVLWLLAMKAAENTAAISNLIFVSPFLSLTFIALILKEEIAIATPVGLGFIILGLLVQRWRSCSIDG